MTRVLRMHRDELDVIDRRTGARPQLLAAAQEAWDDAVDLGRASTASATRRPASWRPPAAWSAARSSPPSGAWSGCGRSATPTAPSGRTSASTSPPTKAPARATKFYVNGLEPVVTVETARGLPHPGHAAAPGQGRRPDHRRVGVEALRRHRAPAIWSRWRSNQLVGEPQAVPLPPLPEAYWTRRAPRRGAPADDRRAGRAASATSWATGRCTPVACGSAWPTPTSTSSSGSSGWARRSSGVAATVTPKTGLHRGRLQLGAARAVVGGLRLRQARPVRGPRRQGLRRPHPRRGPAQQRPRGLPGLPARAVRGRRHGDGRRAHLLVDRRSTSPPTCRALLLALGYPTTRKLGATRTGWGTAPIAVLRLLNAVVRPAVGRPRSASSASARASPSPSSEATQTGRHDHIPLTRRSSTGWCRRTTGCGGCC